MAISVTHSTVATGADEPGAEINKDEWNAGHTVTGAVPDTRTVNGHALSSNVTVTASDVGAPSGSGTSSGTNTGDQDLSGLLVKSSNLSDLTNAGTARTNLGLGTLATQSGTFSGTSSGTNTGDQTISDATISTSDITTNDVSTSKHGFTPKAPNDATKFLDGTGAWDTVKDADLSTSDITTNDVSTSKHGFAPKLPNDATKYLDGTGAYTTPSGGSGISSGTSFPGSPSTNDLYYRTDRSLLYVYNGTRWLTVQQYVVGIAPYNVLPGTAISVTTNSPLVSPAPNLGGYDFWMEELVWSSIVNTTNEGSKYWREDFCKFNTGGGETVIAQPDTSADTVNVWTLHRTAINALLGTSDKLIYIRHTKVSTPGTFQTCEPQLVGRLVG